MLNLIRARKLTDDIEIIDEIVKSIAEEDEDGTPHEIEILQVTFKSVAKYNFDMVIANLYYFDTNGKKIGEDADLKDDAPMAPGAVTTLNIELYPPKDCSYAVLKFEIFKEAKAYRIWDLIAFLLFGALGVLAQNYW
ncbi:hypothetical protein [Ferrimonas pelagia]|uniref:Uncharacterized protein n=1 Tax=Ferrimonas pelagia TaxID=1177826 RepID=A0ABP9EDD7_9GAMM